MKQRKKPQEPKNKLNTQKPSLYKYKCSECGAIIKDLPTITKEVPVEKIVEKKVEIPKIVEKVVEKPVEKIVYKDKIIKDPEQEKIIAELTDKMKILINDRDRFRKLYEETKAELEQIKQQIEKPKPKVVIGGIIKSIDE
jgi:DNA-directed RNA polymerase subunit RPC12/RpoP